MTSVINNNKVAFFLLFVVLITLFVVLAFAVVTHGTGLDIIDTSTMRYCASSGGVCTGV